MSTLEYRYHIIVNGTLDNTRRTKAEAFDYAQNLKRQFNGGRNRVTVFDSMARKGAPQLWSAYRGTCTLVQRREQ